MNLFDKFTESGMQAIAARREFMVHTLLAWSAINSGTGNLDGLAQMRGKLAAAFAGLSHQVETYPAKSAEDFALDGTVSVRHFGDNLHIRKAGTYRRNIVLAGHMDTVFAASSQFQTPIIRDDGTMHGPGVADMKGGLLVMLEALRAFEAGPWAADLGWEIIINSDEETGSLGSAPLFAEVGARCPVGLIFEPATTPDGCLAGARKGSGNFAVRITGLSAHAGRNPEAGRNAVIAAADLAIRLTTMQTTFAGLSVNVAKIDGGSANNVVPDLAVLRWNMRLPSPDIQAAVGREIDACVAAISTSHGVECAKSGGFNRPPKPMDKRALRLFELVRNAGAEMDLPITWHDTGGVCDGNNLASVGVAVVDTMGVRGGNIHSDKEYVILDSLTERAQLAFLTLIRLSREEELFA